ncbi:MAG TPA: hypothetical protein VL242_45065 [Sorangium sp.]|nr:hypothetical protein [Sorangium sp.]
MADDPHPAEMALRFLAMYSQVQESLELTFRRYVEGRSPAVGRFLNRRVRRLSDVERIDAMAAIAVDADCADQWAPVPTVLADLKELRDTIGHATLAGSIEDDDGALKVYANKDGGTVEYNSAELYRFYAQAFWALEQVLCVANISGVTTWDGGAYVRKSGARLVDAPPPQRPYLTIPGDPVILWERLPDDYDDPADAIDRQVDVGDTPRM